MMRFTIAASLALLAVSITSVPAYAYTDAEIDQGLPRGIETARGIDDGCRGHLQSISKRNPDGTITTTNTSGFRFDSAGLGPLRDLLAGAYGATGDGWSSWLSLAGQPNTTNPSPVDYGAASVPMQINAFNMVCAPYTLPSMVPCPSNTTSTATNLYNLWPGHNWVTTGRAKDAGLQPLGTNCYSSPKVREKMLIQGISVVSDVATSNPSTSYPGGRVEMPPGAGLPRTIDIAITRASRYSFGNPTALSYIPGTPIRSQRTITLELRYREMGHFQTRTGGPVSHSCILASTGEVGPIGSDTFAPCRDLTMQFILTIGPSSIYDITPGIQVNTPSINVNGTTGVQPWFDAAGGPDMTFPASDTHWSVARFILRPGDNPGPPNSITDSEQRPCAIYSGYLPGSCNDEVWGETWAGFQPGQRTWGVPQGEPIIGQPPGTRVCYIASISRPTAASTPTHRHSAPRCIIISKAPSVSITGGDVMAGRFDSSVDSSHIAKVLTPASESAGHIYGSWAEYGIGASDTVQSASGGRLARPGGRVTPATPRNALTFANQPSNGNFTPMGNRQNLTTIGADWTPASASSPLDLAGVANRTRYTVASGTTVAGQLPIGRSVVVQSAGDIRISGDITYPDGPYSRPSDIPQLVIIAQNIIIDSSVQRVDAWLVTRDGGTVSTCDAIVSPYYSGLTSTTCNQPLRINGPVNASKLQLRRTFGAEGADDASLSRTAENINLRPDAYIWAYGQASGDGTIRTQHVKELAPRF